MAFCKCTLTHPSDWLQWTDQSMGLEANDFRLKILADEVSIHQELFPITLVSSPSNEDRTSTSCKIWDTQQDRSLEHIASAVQDISTATTRPLQGASHHVSLHVWRLNGKEACSVSRHPCRHGDRPKSHRKKSHRRKVTGKKSKQAVWEGVGIGAGGGGVTVQRVKENPGARRERNTNFVILQVHERRRVGRVQNSWRACPCNCVRWTRFWTVITLPQIVALERGALEMCSVLVVLRKQFLLASVKHFTSGSDFYFDFYQQWQYIFDFTSASDFTSSWKRS